jgi:ElaA protein
MIREIPFEKLNTYELYAILRLRSEVFVVEQNCVYQDLDNADQMATHFIVEIEKQLVACARVLHPNPTNRCWHIGRLCVAETARNKGYAKKLMEETLQFIKERRNTEQRVFLMAQTYLQVFYENYGFQQEGEPFLEDGIPHINMYLAE